MDGMDIVASAAHLLVDVGLVIWFIRLIVPPIGVPARRFGDWCAWFVCTSVWLALTVTVIASVADIWESARCSTCAGRMCSISKGLLDYQNAHGHFPPAYSTDKDGRPLHSWRVLILPYIEEEHLYKKLRIDEPWDSPHNRAVFDSHPMPRIFGCPSQCPDEEDGTKETNYVMIVGRGAISDGPHSVQLEEIADGAANTILFVEMADSGIHWAEPRDLKADEMSYRINDPEKPSISSKHRRGANAAFADGGY